MTAQTEAGDKLRMDKLNALPQPFIGVFLGGDRWPIYDIAVDIGTLRIDVMGLLDIRQFCELRALIDDTGTSHDPDTFWTDYEELAP